MLSVLPVPPGKKPLFQSTPGSANSRNAANGHRNSRAGARGRRQITITPAAHMNRNSANGLCLGATISSASSAGNG